ncbi:glycosyltransferase family 2 protein [Paraflavitalea pollutisoli]|uniref:glycosyltransferase family 2 protein n=1 Tax=Paraflavitalea pollutisoli TaxID=3034143 RepID=UPI0023EBD23B|nr:glycosyltransferase family 2 protein [Paraflavitalea sp. H1-2-19X]
MDVSIVVPLFNEEESLPELCAWIDKVAAGHRLSYEVILCDDGSTDNSWAVVESLRSANPCIKGIRFQRNYGKSAALNEGFKAAKGEVVITMDADLQDSPDEIPELRRLIVEDGYDMVSGWKKVRYDNTLTKNIPSKFFNWCTRRISKIPLHDFNCGLKSYRRKVVKSIEVYGEMHRYIPVLAKWAGFRKIGEKVVEHRKRKYGTTKFGWERFVNGFLDLTSITFVSKYGKRPMHFFGMIGTISFLIGLAMIMVLVIGKFIDPTKGLTNRPPFYISLTAMVIGTQLFMAGFLGELIARNAPGRNNYLIEDKIGIE